MGLASTPILLFLVPAACGLFREDGRHHAVDDLLEPPAQQYLVSKPDEKEGAAKKTSVEIEKIRLPKIEKALADSKELTAKIEKALEDLDPDSGASPPTDKDCLDRLAELDWNNAKGEALAEKAYGACARSAVVGDREDEAKQQLRIAACYADLLALAKCQGQKLKVSKSSTLGMTKDFLDFAKHEAKADGKHVSLTVDWQVVALFWLLGDDRPSEGHAQFTNLYALSSAVGAAHFVGSTPRPEDPDMSTVWKAFLPDRCEERLSVLKHQVQKNHQGVCNAEANGASCSLECGNFLRALWKDCPDIDKAAEDVAPLCTGLHLVGDAFDKSATTRFLSSFGWMSFVTLLAVLLRNNVSFLRKYGIPTSLIAGIMGFLFLNLVPMMLSRDGGKWFTIYFHQKWDSLASFGITIVFAVLFVGTPLPGIGTIAKEGGPQLLFGLTCVFGQFGLAFAISELMSAHALAGVAIPVGFAGGHGTAAAVTDSLNGAGWKLGKDWCIASATISLLVAVFGGTGLINVGRARGWLPAQESGKDAGAGAPKDLLTSEEFTHNLSGTIRESSMDSYAFHIVLTGCICALGYLMQRLLILCYAQFEKLPSFVLCLIASLVVQAILQKLGATHLVDRATLGSISNVALYYIVFCGVATMDLAGLASGATPLLILCACALVFMLVMCLCVAPYFFEDYWFERALFEWGAGVGTTPIGLLLMSMADPEKKAMKVHKAIGYKLMLHEPITNVYLTLALTLGMRGRPDSSSGTWLVSGMSTVAALCTLGVGLYLRYRGGGGAAAPLLEAPRESAPSLH